MELNNYRSVTPLKKKKRKVTASAALVLCLISLLIGVLCGKASVKGPSEKQIAQKIEQVEKDYADNVQKLKETYEEEINNLNKKLAEANQAAQETVQPALSEPSAQEGDVPAQQDDLAPTQEKKASNGIGRTLLIIVLIGIIGVCIFLAVRIFFRRNDDDYDDYDDEDYDDEYDDEDYDDDEYEDDEDDEYDDEEYEDDEE